MLLPFRNFITYVLLQEKNVSCITHKETITSVVIVQLLSCVQLFAAPCSVACQAPLSSTISQSLFKFKSFECCTFKKKKKRERENIQKWVKEAKWLLMLREGAIFMKENV